MRVEEPWTRLIESRPITHVAKGKSIPSFCLMYVANNPLTGGQAQRLSKALLDEEISARLVAGENKTHNTINAELGLPDDKPTKALLEFLDAVLK